MKPFDLEAAKRGEPIEFKDRDGEWKPAFFVGLTFRGIPFIQHLNGSSTPYAPTGYHESDLRMAPKKVTWYCRHYIDYNGNPNIASCKGGPIMDNWLSFGKWHGKPFTIEVEE